MCEVPAGLELLVEKAVWWLDPPGPPEDDDEEEDDELEEVARASRK